MTVLTTEQQVLDMSDATTVVLWQLEHGFLSTSIYHRYSPGGKWTIFDPEERSATDHDYTNANLWAIATLRQRKSVVSVADGTHRVASFEELALLPRYTIVEAGDNIYQNFGGEWRQMDPWSDPEEDTLRLMELWEWHGTEPGITLIWHPSETGWVD